MSEVDIVCWAHRPHPIQDLCERSVREKTTGDYAYHLMIAPGTCSENMNRAYHTGSARYVCLVDEDVQFLTSGWSEKLIAALSERPDAGVISCVEIKYADMIDAVLALAESLPIRGIDQVLWVPAYVTLYDRERTSWLVFDERIPGRKGLSDIDACMQLESHGLRSYLHRGVYVHHPYKSDADADRLAMQTTTLKEEHTWAPEQMAYFHAKWGWPAWERCCAKPFDGTVTRASFR